MSEPWDIRLRSYSEILGELEGLLGEHWFTDLANFSAVLFNSLPDLNWCGFYLRMDSELFLGPFQGMPACQRIPWGKGVCGTAAAQDKTLRVDDVHTFPGHISCDERSLSEIVIPLRLQGKVCAILDIDSPRVYRFSAEDQTYLERAVQILTQNLEMKYSRPPWQEI
jgi:GAF domain-containing protein